MKGWFSPIKGAYPSLQQIDRTLAVADGNTKIVRGSIIAVDKGKFRLGRAEDVSDLYIALQDYTDAQAGMAGAVNYNAGATRADDDSGISDFGNVKPGTPTITGLSLRMPGEYQTNQIEGPAFEVGDKLKVGADGKFEKAGPEDGAKAVAVVTKAKFNRWVNDYDANQMPTMTGASVPVIQFATL